MNLPAPQLSHWGCFSSGCTVPALHGTSLVLPVGAKWPLSVGVHWSALRRAGALGAVRARLAADARLLALALLIRAGRALVARGHARVWRDRARAALTRLRRARTARRSRRARQAVVGARHREVELQHRLVLVRASLARQRGRRALRAVRAGRARPARQLARRGLEGAGLALETRAHARVGRDRAGAARRLLGAARRREVARVGLRALTTVGKAGGDRVRARQAREGDGGALGTVMALRAGCRRHRCLCAAREARWAKPCTRRARLLAGERSIAAEHTGRAGKGVVQVVRPEWQDVHCLAEQGWVIPPVAGLVEGGGLAGTGRDVAVVDVVDEVYLAACGGRSASRAGRVLGTRLSPDLALGRGHPVARWRGQRVGGGAAGAEVEICTFWGAVVHDLGSCHGEGTMNIDTSTLPISAARVTPSRNGCRRSVHAGA
eukprot:scaffold81063_cov64-Phaeocystis_antarctica.AAC.3